jgi:hypothetical protein
MRSPKLIRLLLGLLILGNLLPGHPLNAQATGLNVDAMAAYFSNVEFFVASRLDATFLDKLDSIGFDLSSSATAPVKRLSSLVSTLIKPSWRAMLSLGQAHYGAVGISGLDDLLSSDPARQKQARLRILVQYSGRQTVEFLLGQLTTNCQKGTQTLCDLPQYNAHVLIADSWLIVFYGQESMTPQPTDSLSTQANFQQARQSVGGRCPSDLFVYLNTPHFAPNVSQTGIRQILQLLGLGLDTLSGTAASLCFNTGDQSLTFDVAQPRSGTHVQMPPLKTTFVSNIPAGSSFLMARDLSTIPHTLADVFSGIDGLLPQEEAYSDIKTVIQHLFQIDLDKDVLSWANQSHYAAFLWLEPAAPPPVASLHLSDIQTGFVLEATDPEKARAVSAAIAQGLMANFAQDARIAVSSDTYQVVRGGTAIAIPVTRVVFKDDKLGEMHLLIGTTDKIGFFATEKAVDRIFQGATIDTDAQFTAAAQNIDPTDIMIAYLGAHETSYVISTIFDLLVAMGSSNPLNAIILPEQTPGATPASVSVTRVVSHGLLEVRTSADGTVHLTTTIFLVNVS